MLTIYLYGANPEQSQCRQVKRVVCQFEGGDLNEANKQSKSHNLFKFKMINNYDLA